MKEKGFAKRERLNHEGEQRFNHESKRFCKERSFVMKKKGFAKR